MTGTLCIYNTPPPPDCSYTLTLNDDGFDGWDDFWDFTDNGTSAVEIKIDGISYGTYSQVLFDATAPITFGVNNGQVVDLVYAGTGPSQEDNSYELASCSGGVLFNSGTSPASGTAYTGSVACGAQGPADCLGAVTICSSTPSHFTNSISGAGCSSDIDVTNDHCITTEGVGSWYYFSPSSAGTIGFTITPTASVDYDFSLWGPYTGPAHCPTNTPTRCSSYTPFFLFPLYTTGVAAVASGGMDSPLITVPTGDIGKFYVLYIENASGSTGQDFSLTWQLGGGATLDCTVLPIELISLQAQAREQVVDITWATATEQNSERYEIQRSFDDSSYATIGTLPAAGDAQYRTDYAFTDNTPGHGANYYRLKEVDRDGAITITHTVVALMDGSSQVPKLFPNPVTRTLNVSFTAFRDGMALLTARDALGRSVMEQQSPVHRGQQTVRLPMDGLLSGCYSLSVTLPSGVVVHGSSFVKQ